MVGAGPAGSTLATVLARLGRSVLVIERSAYEASRPGEHLPPSAHALLRQLGSSDRLTAPHLISPGITHSWGDSAIRHRDYMFDPYGSGLLLDRREFDQDLAEIARHSGATLFAHNRLASLQAQPDGSWLVQTTDHTARSITFRAGFLVDATGRLSIVGRRLAAKRRRFDRLVGVMAQVAVRPMQNVSKNRLVVESTETGWWYMAVVPSERAVAVFMTDADQIGTPRSDIAHVWRHELMRTNMIRSAFSGAADSLVRVLVRSADTSILEPMYERSWIAIGEAAVAYDPLSSRGVVRAMQSGMEAATAIDSFLDGDRMALAVYAREQKDRFRRYLVERRQMYQQEQRWPASPFWSRRHSVPSSTASGTPVREAMRRTQDRAHW